MMNIHLLQHVPFEGPGSIAGFARRQGHALTPVRLFENNPLPDPNGVEALVVMGGPMSVNDESEFPWLVAEKIFIRRLIEQEKPVLGICLGAQLIASALGARVYQGTEKEIGWYPIDLTPEAKSTAPIQSWPENPVVFHWHGETFDLPDGAVRLASSKACENQAFLYGKRVIGLQFHLEMEEEDINRMIQHCGDEITESTYIQTTEEMTSMSFHIETANKLMNDMLTTWLDPVG